MYLPNTNVLVTRFFTDQGMAELTDFMPIGREAGGQTEQCSRQIVRIARAIRGPIPFRMECRPAFDYARQPHTIELTADRRTAIFSAAGQQYVLKSPRELVRDGDGVVAEFALDDGEEVAFALRCGGGQAVRSLRDEPLDGPALLQETVRFWHGWAGQSLYHGRWREVVTRSALALKLLTYLPTGAIVAAPTTSLPEAVGGVRNWDYRYTWVRDAAFTVYSLIRLGYTEEAAAFAQFMQARAQEESPDAGPLNVLYGIDGRHDLTEETLTHLEGYCGSRPVRVGNAAYGHLQLDIYGELMDSIYLYDKYGTPLSYEMWSTAARLLDWVAKNWEQADQSIWEVRGDRRQFTYSKLQCWVALDRGLRLARKRSFPTEGDAWRRQRNRIYNAIMRDGWNEREGAFTQVFGSDARGRGHAHDAAHAVRLAPRPAHAGHHRARPPRPGFRRAGAPLQHRKGRARRPSRPGRLFHPVLLLDGGSHRPRRPGRGGAVPLRKAALLRQPPRPVLGRNQRPRRVTG